MNMMRADKPVRSAKLQRLAALLIAIAGLGTAGCDDNGGDPKRQIGANPVLPPVQQYLIPPIRIAKAVRWGKDETPTVPQGLQVHALATGFAHPRSLYVLPNGDVLVVESNGPKAPIFRPKDIITGWVQWFAGAKAKDANRITLLRGTNGDGTAVLRTVFLDHLNSPFGVALVGNDLYVANTDAIVRYPYQDGQTSITAAGTKLTDLPGGPIDHHWTKSLLASQDGSKLYVGVGSNSNIGENGIGAEFERAAIWEVDRASGAHRIFASGIRNPTGLQWEPETGKLWAIANERDEIGPDLVPDYLTSVRDGGFYGWPYSYYGQHLDPRIMPQRPDLVARAIPPDYALSSHVAPLGVAMYTGNDLPYRGGAFVSEHGSWDRTPLNGYKVVFVPFSGGQPSGPPQDAVTGFLDANDHARGRPVGLAVDRSGALLIADDVGNTVWRVSSLHTGPQLTSGS
jgi:glucose/arabinose dehydrogenase